jgi:hypothetical protein
MEKAVKGVEIGMCRWKSAQIRTWGDDGVLYMYLDFV